MTLEISRKRIVRALAWVIAAIVGINLVFESVRFETGHANLLGLLPLMSVNGDTNIPTWFSSFELLIAAVLLWAVSRAEKQAGYARAAKWRAMGVVFLLMSIDETAAMHERLDHVGKMFARWINWPTYLWLMVGIFIVAAFCVYFARFTLNLPSRLRMRCLVSAVVFISGAIFMEAFNGYYEKKFGISWTSENLTILEETLEMAGVLLFIDTLLWHLASLTQEVKLELVVAPLATADPKPAAIDDPDHELLAGVH